MLIGQGRPHACARKKEENLNDGRWERAAAESNEFFI